MPGLLKKLQKDQDASQGEVQEVLLQARPSAPEGVFVLDQVVEVLDDENVVSGVIDAVESVTKSADAVLGEASEFSTKAKGSSKSQPSRVVRSAPSKSQEPVFDDNAPWWLSEQEAPIPQVEVLVPAAQKILENLMAVDSKEVLLADVVRRAVQGASEALRDEVRLTRKVQDQAERELLSLLVGKGPLAPLYEDGGVTDVFIDSHRSIKVIRRGHAMETPFAFRSEDEYRLFIRSMLGTLERTLDESSPIVDCVLEDEWRTRVNAIDPSVLEAKEPRLCLRIPRLQKIAFYDILQTKTLPPTLAAWLAEVVAIGEANILVLGPAGAGKTVMTTALLSAVNSDERIITIEDVPELFVPTTHLEKLVARPADSRGEGEVTMPQLLKAALRRAPHRIVVGEIRDEEGRIFLRALETGHAGSIATIHAENSRDALWRLLDLVASYEQAPQESIMRRVGRSVHLTISMKKIDGSPCLTEVAEVCMPDGHDFYVKPLVTYAGKEKGKRRWHLHCDDSYWVSRVEERGLPLMPGPSLSVAPPSDANTSAAARRER